MWRSTYFEYPHPWFLSTELITWKSQNVKLSSFFKLMIQEIERFVVVVCIAALTSHIHYKCHLKLKTTRWVYNLEGEDMITLFLFIFSNMMSECLSLNCKWYSFLQTLQWKKPTYLWVDDTTILYYSRLPYKCAACTDVEKVWKCPQSDFLKMKMSTL